LFFFASSFASLLLCGKLICKIKEVSQTAAKDAKGRKEMLMQA
jgi:hypothetical protein